MQSLFLVFDLVLELLLWVIVAQALLGWLAAFQIINPRQRLVAVLLEMLNRLCEPLLRPIRRVVPRLGGVDLSSIVLLLLITLLRSLLREYGPL